MGDFPEYILQAIEIICDLLADRSATFTRTGEMAEVPETGVFSAQQVTY
jgi:hypothetical protein